MARARFDSTILPLLALLTLTGGPFLGAAEPTAAETTAAETQFDALCKRYQTEQTAAWSELENVTEPKQRSRIYQDRHPANSMVAEFLKFEETHRGTQLGFSALYHLVSVAGGNAFMPEFLASDGGRQALKRLTDHYLSHPDLDVAFWSTTNGGDEAKSLLRRARTNSAPHVRGAAALKLAEICKAEATVPAWFDSVLGLLSANPDVHSELIKTYSARRKEWTADPVVSRQDALRLLDEVQQHYADVLEPPRTPYGPIVVKIDRSPIDQLTNKQRRTLAERAESFRFQLTNLTIGQPAPDIAGLDAYGRDLKLSDNRGKVTVLMFSFKGCGPCEAMYPGNRQLLEQYRNRPFAFLGVMGDDDISTVKESVESGTITWPVWWDGARPGPIANRWNVIGWPDIYVLDHHGIIRYTELTSDLLEIAIARLIKEAERK